MAETLTEYVEEARNVLVNTIVSAPSLAVPVDTDLMEAVQQVLASWAGSRSAGVEPRISVGTVMTLAEGVLRRKLGETRKSTTL